MDYELSDAHKLIRDTAKRIAREKVAPRALTASAVLLSSLAFGALHQDFLLGAVAGLAFAGAWALRGRLGDAVVGVSHECDWPPEAAGGRPGPPRETSGFARAPVRVTRPS